MAGPIRALIVEDEPLARERLKMYLADEPDVEIIGECADGRQAVAAIRSLGPDLVFLDIQLPELDGFGVVEEVGAESMPVVVFITAYDQHAMRAFDVYALDYLLKPYKPDRLRRAVERARAQVLRGKGGALNERLLSLLESVRTGPQHVERLMIKSPGRVYFIRADEIDWIESEGNYVRIHAGKESHFLRDTLGGMEARLDQQKFVRIHRSTIVNVESIKELQPLFSGDYTVILHSGERLTMSRGHKEKLLSLIGK
ncbi:MAG TPA: LytTR family DNA-binding domain-containing protein [Pyrinomonadaceae bacterium]|nr:LytTR family DNA-binding domain-containing protein [Pyrinomonadaceae bacterium]